MDCEKREYIFDFGIETPLMNYNIGIGFNFGSNPSFEFTFDFQRPKIVGLNVYGMAKKNNQWHGKRMVF